MIDDFRGQYFFLSNFYTSPFEAHGKKYLTNEHYFQAHKATTNALHDYVRTAKTAVEAKKRGRSVNCREDWQSVKNDIMLEGLRLKFKSDPLLTAKLLDTKDEELIEGNWWNDTYWGVCEGSGQNMLGKLLMQVREELK